MAETALTSTMQWVLQEFADGLVAAFEGMTGSRPEISFEVLPALPTTETYEFRWQQSFNSLSAPAYIAIKREDVLAAGQQVMSAAGVDDCSPEDLKSTFIETLGQAFSMLARSFTARLQREITPSAGREHSELSTEAQWGSVRVSFSNAQIALAAGFPAALLEAFAPIQKAQAACAGADAGSSVALPTPASRGPVDESQTFDLLLDVELPVSVSFGHAYVPLKDVLKLTTGSIVELSRAIVEPVDIVVNNCVIAKGEVVVVEGNFGVRIQHVVSRTERLRTLQ